MMKREFDFAVEMNKFGQLEPLCFVDHLCFLNLRSGIEINRSSSLKRFPSNQICFCGIFVEGNKSSIGTRVILEYLVKNLFLYSLFVESFAMQIEH